MIIGIDASLTNTGIVEVLPNGGIESSTVWSPKVKGVERLDWFRQQFTSFFKRKDRTENIECVVLEGYAYAAFVGRAFDIGELGGLIKLCVYDTKCPLYIVTPTQLKKYITGKGKGPKDQVFHSACTKWTYEFQTTHEAEAYGLARIGLDILNVLKASGDSEELVISKVYKTFEKEVIKAVIKGKANE